jgi:RHS repeat-associated protein
VAIAHVTKAGGTEMLVAGQALTRSAGGTITKIDTYRTGASYDSATGQFSGTPSLTQNFEYDGNARLTREERVKSGDTTDTRYEYDAAGNRTKKTVTTAAGAEITTYSYDNADRLTSETTSLPAGGTRAVTYTWDGNGNLASKTEPGKTTLYRFDPQNWLIDIRTGASQAEANAARPSVSYAYDAAGNRIRKTTSQGTTGYLIDGSHAYPQVALESKGGEATSYLHGVQIVRQTKGSDDLFPLPGHLNTSLGAVDAGGAVAEQTSTDAFGNLEQATAPKQAHLYAGEYWDQDSQLLYLRARWYDPKIGSFLSADPFEGKQRDPRSLNRYSYAHSDPVHGTDPTGEMTMIDVGMGAMLNVAIRAALPTIKTAAIACTAIAAASILPTFQATDLPGPLGACTANTMRVQLQVSPLGGGGVTLHTEGYTVLGVLGIGVTVSAVEAKMQRVFYERPSWWPGALESGLIGMMARTSIKLRRYPPGGTGNAASPFAISARRRESAGQQSAKVLNEYATESMDCLPCITARTGCRGCGSECAE